MKNRQQVEMDSYLRELIYDREANLFKFHKAEVEKELIKNFLPLPIVINNHNYSRETRYYSRDEGVVGVHDMNLEIVWPDADGSTNRNGINLHFKVNFIEKSYILNWETRVTVTPVVYRYFKIIENLYENEDLKLKMCECVKHFEEMTLMEKGLGFYEDELSRRPPIVVEPLNVGDILEITYCNNYSYRPPSRSEFRELTFSGRNWSPKPSENMYRKSLINQNGSYVYTNSIETGYMRIEKFYKKNALVSIVGPSRLLSKYLSHNFSNITCSNREPKDLPAHYSFFDVPLDSLNSLINVDYEKGSINTISYKRFKSPIAQKMFSNSYNVHEQPLERTVYAKYKGQDVSYSGSRNRSEHSVPHYRQLSTIINKPEAFI